jgi:translation initiation factor IF-3
VAKLNKVNRLPNRLCRNWEIFLWADYVICPFFVVIKIRRCIPISKQELSINEEIRDKEVRLIDSDGSQLGVVSAEEALRQAAARDLDLVKIAPNAQPPVCKILDYGKYRFEQAKREKEARKSQKVIEVKEIRLGLNIDVHDFNTKAKQAKKFIASGDKIKVSIRFRGRELGHPEIGLDTMNRFAEACAEFAAIEKPAKMEGRNMLMFLAPKKN